MSLIFVTILWLITDSVFTTGAQSIQNDSLCHKRKDLRVLSVFSLKDDLFIQLINESGSTQFWRIFGATYGQTSDKDVESIISSDVTDGHYYDHNMTQALDNRGYNLKLRVYGYTVPILDNSLYEKCQFYWLNLNITKKIDYPYTNESCQVLSEMMDGVGGVFACFNGWHVYGYPQPWPFIYDPDQGTLTPITVDSDLELRADIASLCIPLQLNEWTPIERYLSPNVAFYQTWDDDNANWYNITVIQYDTEPGKASENVKIRVRMDVENKRHEFTDTYPRNEDFLVFRFNNYYKFMHCSEDCTLDSKLIWRDYTFNATIKPIGRLYPYSPILTIRKLLACKPPNIQFNSTQFCQSGQQFLSIFNLGADVYFQRSGRFWRYNPKGFSNVTNPDINFKISPIHLDSEMTAFLDKNEYDTNRLIYGFTFHSPVYEMCERGNESCQTKYDKTKEYFRSCLYGTQTFHTKHQTDQTDDRSNLLIKAFMYTTSGLIKFTDTNIFEETNTFCRDFWFKVRDYPVFGREESSDMISAINSISIEGDRILNRIYILFTKQSAKTYLLRLQWNADLPPKFKDIVKDQLIEVSIPAKFFFSVADQFWGYGSEMNGSLYRFDFPEVGVDIGSKIATTLWGEFGCPFNSSSSLVRIIEREKVCEERHTLKPESILTIGVFTYHQMGQYFYAFNENGLFLYNRYLSDLLNNYFDTTYRVTGYSVPISQIFTSEPNGSYVVFIYGKSNYMFREVGEYIFGMFSIRHPFSSLTAFNDVKTHSFHPYASLSKATLPQNMAVLAAHFLTIPSTQKSHAFAFVLTLVTKSPGDDQNYIIYTNAHKSDALFGFNTTFNKEVWDTHSYAKSKDNQDIVGISELYDKSAVLMAVRANLTPQDIKQYYLFKYLPSGYESYLEKGVANLPQGRSYNQDFCQNEPTEGESGSESDSSSKVLNYILALFVLILLIIALFVGSFNYYNNQKYAKQPKPAKSLNSDSRVETVNPIRPNYTVVRHPEPNTESNNKEDPDKEEISIRDEEI